jgi:hypothetical protein
MLVLVEATEDQLVQEQAVAVRVLQGQMVRVLLVALIPLLQVVVEVAVMAVGLVVLLVLQVQQELVLVQAVQVEQQTHQVAQAGQAPTQRLPMYSPAAAVVVQVMVHLLQLVVLAVALIMVQAL